jgi:CRISPR system Cascade subunit CasB
MESNEGVVEGKERSLSAQIGSIRAFLEGAKSSEGSQKGDYVALARLDPMAAALTAQQIAALTRALLRAKVECEHMTLMRWKRWAHIAQGMAVTIDCANDKTASLGKRLALAGISEARLMRLLNARGDAFFQTLPRIVQLMASRKVAPEWTQLGALILNEGARDAASARRVDVMRVKIVRDFARAKAALASKPAADSKS